MKSVLFTGASGFLGNNILSYLQMQFDVKTMGLSPEDTYNVNIATTVPVLNHTFDVVLHAAGKSHVIPKSKEEEKLFFDINYQGTVNVCRALESSGIPKAFIFISTVAV